MQELHSDPPFGYIPLDLSQGVDVIVSSEPQGFGDLEIDASDNTIVSSVVHPFASADVGKILIVLPMAGFTAGFYLIVSVSDGAATLNAAIGTVGSTGGKAAFASDCHGLLILGAGTIKCSTLLAPTVSNTLSVPIMLLPGRFAKVLCIANGTTATGLCAAYQLPY